MTAHRVLTSQKLTTSGTADTNTTTALVEPFTVRDKSGNTTAIDDGGMYKRTRKYRLSVLGNSPVSFWFGGSTVVSTANDPAVTPNEPVTITVPHGATHIAYQSSGTSIDFVVEQITDGD